MLRLITSSRPAGDTNAASIDGSRDQSSRMPFATFPPDPSLMSCRARSVMPPVTGTPKLSVSGSSVLPGTRAPFFVVKYTTLKNPDMGGNDILYANSFSSGCNDRVLEVYDPALAVWTKSLTSIFCHELGHILGLRHGDADAAREAPWVQLTPMNEQSIMRARFEEGTNVKIQGSDMAAVKMLQELEEDSIFEGFRVVTVDPATLGQVKAVQSGEIAGSEARCVGSRPGTDRGHKTTITAWLAISLYIFLTVGVTAMAWSGIGLAGPSQCAMPPAGGSGEPLPSIKPPPMALNGLAPTALLH